MCCSTFVIATSSELPSPRRRDVTHQSTDDDDDDDDKDAETAARLVGEFYVLQYLNHHEPVHGFLGELPGCALELHTKSFIPRSLSKFL